MNILFDVISTQKFMSGGGEYVKKLFQTLISLDNKVFCLYDSSLKWDEHESFFFQKNTSELVDIKQNPISFYVDKYEVDIFFIGIAQRFLSYDMRNIDCRTIVVIHDIGDIERFSNGLEWHYKKNIKNYLRLNVDYLPFFRKKSSIQRTRKLYSSFINFLIQENVEIITVSNYSLNSIKYYFPLLQNKKIEVLYPPEKITEESDVCQNKRLENLVNGKNKYLLLVSADRNNKNAILAFKVFDRINEIYPDLLLVVTNNKDFQVKNTLSFKFLSVSDLNILYKNAQALLYPSISEGFGYPTIEAMKYSIPILSSNVCSMPEVLGDSAIYFSPFYENDLYSKILFLLDNRDKYVKKSQNQFSIINEKQKLDFEILVSKFSN